MAVQTDFLAAVNQIAAERGIDAGEVVEAIGEAIATGFRQNYPEESNINITVSIDADLGSIKVNQNKVVVKSVIDPESEVTKAEASKLGFDANLGETVAIDITPQGDFGRVAAQAAKQVILQKIREAERETQLQEFKDRLGEVEFAVVQRVDRDTVIWEVGKAIAIMPAEDRIVSEYYRSGSRHKVLLKDIVETPRGKSLLVSRADSKFLQALFELEVPELTTGSVEIKNIAREAGSRSKVAVHSNVDGVDPIGSCVGQKGVRINSIMNELRIGEREEKIDIILWDENDEKFIANAISPAKVVEVKILDREKREVVVVVPDDQLSLAIGRDGQNVRLAAKLTGWGIDIEGESGEDTSAKPVLGEETGAIAPKMEDTEKEDSAEVESVAAEVEADTESAASTDNSADSADSGGGDGGAD